jgi:DNA-binding NtrC family response regulator
MDSPSRSAPPHPTARLLGSSPAIAALRAQIRQLAPFDSPGSPLVPTVLLQGETGTGKGLVARVMHASGPRAAGPFLEVNCAAIPDALLEAELFGYEPGAFTDAKRPHPGLFEAAAGGTLFLDEIDALPLALQGKVLTALESKVVRRLGAVGGRQVDVKLIAASNVALAGQVGAGRFRADLYHRLAVVVVEVPPLRARGEDVVELAQAWLEGYARALGVRPKRCTAGAVAWLQQYGWPGNVRELHHVLERVTLLHAGEEVETAVLQQLCRPLTPSPAQTEQTRASQTGIRQPALPAEAERLHEALALAGRNVVQGPLRSGEGYGIVRVLHIERARLDEATREAIKEILFAEWLAGRRREATVEWFWGKADPAAGDAIAPSNRDNGPQKFPFGNA